MSKIWWTVRLENENISYFVGVSVSGGYKYFMELNLLCPVEIRVSRRNIHRFCFCFLYLMAYQLLWVIFLILLVLAFLEDTNILWELNLLCPVEIRVSRRNIHRFCFCFLYLMAYQLLWVIFLILLVLAFLEDTNILWELNLLCPVEIRVSRRNIHRFCFCFLYLMAYQLLWVIFLILLVLAFLEDTNILWELNLLCPVEIRVSRRNIHRFCFCFLYLMAYQLLWVIFLILLVLAFLEDTNILWELNLLCPVEIRVSRRNIHRFCFCFLYLMAYQLLWVI